jgi:Domain of unknown function (DUF4365)
LSRAYVRAIAARAEVVCVEATQDFGIDFYLRAVTFQAGRYSDTGPELDVQLKSTTRAEMSDTEVIHDLEVRAYNLLREHLVPGWPRILVLLVLPEDEVEWLTHTVDELILRRCAYWVSLRGSEPVTAHRTVRIALPRGNVFSAEALVELLDRVKQGESP